MYFWEPWRFPLYNWINMCHYLRVLAMEIGKHWWEFLDFDLIIILCLEKFKNSDKSLCFASKSLQSSACRMWVDAFLFKLQFSPLATTWFALYFAYIFCLTSFLSIFYRALHWGDFSLLTRKELYNTPPLTILPLGGVLMRRREHSRYSIRTSQWLIL